LEKILRKKKQGLRAEGRGRCGGWEKWDPSPLLPHCGALTIKRRTEEAADTIFQGRLQEVLRLYYSKKIKGGWWVWVGKEVN